MGLVANAKRVHYYLSSHLFKGVDFKGKTLLDVGGGRGVYSCITSTLGATKATIVEPIAEGSNDKMMREFEKIKSLLPENTAKISLVNNTFQEFDSAETYDIVLFHNSINHLNEPACEKLPKDEEAQQIYQNIFKKLVSLTHANSYVILSDASRANIFNDL